MKEVRLWEAESKLVEGERLDFSVARCVDFFVLPPDYLEIEVLCNHN